MKWKVSEIVKECEVNLNGFLTKVNLNILPLGSYDILIGMDSLEQHHVMLDFLHKYILCTDRQGNQVKVQGLPKKFSVRQIFSLQAKKCVRKGCKLFTVNIRDVVLDKEQCIEDFPVLEEFKDVFPDEIPILPLKRDLYFSIELTPGSVPPSKAPYHMSAPELVELKLQLQELIEKGYIRPSVSHWGALILFVKKKDGMMRMCIDYH